MSIQQLLLALMFGITSCDHKSKLQQEQNNLRPYDEDLFSTVLSKPVLSMGGDFAAEILPNDTAEMQVSDKYLISMAKKESVPKASDVPLKESTSNITLIDIRPTQELKIPYDPRGSAQWKQQIHGIISSEESALDAKLRYNDFFFSMKGLSNFDIDLRRHFVTAGQPFKGVSTNYCSHSGCSIRVKAGRHGTSTVANWFKKLLYSGSAVGCDTNAKRPSKLNFLIEAKLSFEYLGKKFVGKDIILAQGHNSKSRNNWWIGGPYMNKPSDKVVAQIFLMQDTEDTQKNVTVHFTVSGAVSSVKMEVF